MAGKGHVLLRDRERRAGCDADLLRDEVEAGDRFRDRVLHLQSGIHLNEIELAVLVEEFDRARAPVAELLHRLGDGRADLDARFGVERRGMRFLEDLLVPALQRAVALTQVHGATPSVAEHLNLDVARLRQVLFQIDRIVAEGGLRFRAGGRERDGQLFSRASDLHAAPAAAGSRLDKDREAHVLGDAHRVLLVFHGSVRARYARNAEAAGRVLGLDLVAHDADVLGRRPDERDLVLFEDLGEARVLG